MITISNGKFTAEIDPLGAQLTTLTRSSDGRSYIWNDTTGKFWGRHAPILFPSIGRSNDDHYVLDGKQYAMRQHGFARDLEFDSIEQPDDASVNLTLHATDESRAIYPFDFALTVSYKLTDKGLRTDYTIANNSAAGTQSMPFAFGSHPAFALSQPLENYTVTVNDAKTPLTKFGIGPVPFRNGKVEPFSAAKGNVIPLSHELLDDGLIIINDPEATSATLAAKDGSYSVNVDLSDFPYVTLWSPEHKNAPFVCVEPFHGLPDIAGEPGDWQKKPGNTSVAAGNSVHLGYDLTLD